MKIAIIEHYTCTSSNPHRQNRSYDWEWDVEETYSYTFYCSERELSDNQYKIISKFLKESSKYKKESIECNWGVEARCHLAYDFDKTQILAKQLGCQAFEPSKNTLKIFKHEETATQKEDTFINFDPDWDDIVTTKPYIPTPTDIRSTNVEEYDNLPIVKYLKLTKQGNYWKGEYNGESITLNGDLKLCPFGISTLIADVLSSTYNLHSKNGINNYDNGNIDHVIAIKDNKYGVVDKSGNIIFEYQSFEITELYSTFCIIKNDDNYSCIDFSGRTLMPFTSNDFIIHWNRFAEVTYDSYKLIYDLIHGGVILNAQYKQIEQFTEKCIFVKNLDDRIDIYNYNSLKLNKEPLIEATDSHESIIIGKRPQGWIVIDYNGKIILEDSYNDYQAIKAIDGHIRLLKTIPNGYHIHGLADLNGNIIFPCYSDSPIKIFQSGGESYYILRKYKKDRIYNKKGHALSAEYDLISKDTEGTCIAFNGNYTTEKGKLKTEQGKFYAITVSQQILFTIDCQYLSYFVDGLAIFRKDGKFGILNKEGHIVISPTYDVLRHFQKGLAAACLNNKWGFIDTNNKVIIDFKYDSVGDFNDKVEAYVQIGGEYWYIDQYEIPLEEKKTVPGYYDDYSGCTPIIDQDYINDGLAEAFNNSSETYWNID